MIFKKTVLTLMCLIFASAQVSYADLATGIALKHKNEINAEIAEIANVLAGLEVDLYLVYEKLKSDVESDNSEVVRYLRTAGSTLSILLFSYTTARFTKLQSKSNLPASYASKSMTLFKSSYATFALTNVLFLMQSFQQDSAYFEDIKNEINNAVSELNKIKAELNSTEKQRVEFIVSVLKSLEQTSENEMSKETMENTYNTIAVALSGIVGFHIVYAHDVSGGFRTNMVLGIIASLNHLAGSLQDADKAKILESLNLTIASIQSTKNIMLGN